MGHKAKNPTHILKCLPRMSWSPANLYNLYQRSLGPQAAETRFTKSPLTMFQQRWKAKRLIRAYHGDWLTEGTFKKNYVPRGLPPIVAKPEEESVPLTSMMVADIEKRLDTVVFRCCFSDSIYKARQIVVHGKVKVNGAKVSDPNTLLQPGDLITVEPSAVSTLKRQKSKQVEPEASDEANSASETSSTSMPSSSSSPSKPLSFELPEFASPFLFVPPYLEVSYTTCSAIYLRHPSAGPGFSEVPSPYDAGGEVFKLTWEYYAAFSGRKGPKRPPHLVGKRLGA